MDLDKHTFPNGGWYFRQAQTGWTTPTPIASTFDQTCVLIAQHRLKNPAIVVKHKLSTDLGEIGEELLKFTRLRLGLPDPPPRAPSFFPPGRAQSGLDAAAANLRRAAQGTAVVLDWLQSGGHPVAQELADRRAAICVACPKNVAGEWYTVAPAEIIKAALQARADLKLETPSDAQLKSCDVCKCLMRLKVWTPLEPILQRTRPEVMAEFPPHCWIARKDQ